MKTSEKLEVLKQYFTPEDIKRMDLINEKNIEAVYFAMVRFKNNS